MPDKGNWRSFDRFDHLEHETIQYWFPKAVSVSFGFGWLSTSVAKEYETTVGNWKLQH